ncbi:hypothetical protein [Stenotrophomonas sp. GZD-301]|uniref:hypothetical protein n=1 Tax=Stenotrophomonas sp. GZD-301 TaxID=3404814 RepID=UPI003BB75BD6
MSRKPHLKQPSLLDYFTAPDGCVGEFGWICGFSADAAFINQAAENFTTQSAAQRAAAGQISLALMLDPSQPALLPTAIPGVAHLPLQDLSRKPFRLLHAKVALLGFRDAATADRHLLRLVVSTGNWTRQTVEESLDLAWCVDLEVAPDAEDDAVSRADMCAAQALFAWLLDLHDTRLLEADTPLSGRESADRVDQWIAHLKPSRRVRPRLLDTRSRSLLKQIVDGLEREGGVARNHLCMGSGFYEAATAHKGGTALPTLPHKVVKRLKDYQLLAPRAHVDLYVNPQACQAIAGAVDQLGQDPDHPIRVRAAAAPAAVFGTDSQRTLHAKFLFSSNRSKTTGACNSAWLYLGSGNLTTAGLLSAASPAAGNLEAGILVFPDGLFWEKGHDPAQWIQNLLPIGGDVVGDLPALQPGDPWAPPPPQHVAAPIAYLVWTADGRLTRPDPTAGDVEVLDAAGTPCAIAADGYAWSGPAPRLVRVRWVVGADTHLAWVPVIDAHGRVAATPLPAIDLDHAWTQLAAFPRLPEEEEGEGEGDPGILPDDRRDGPDRRTPPTLGTGTAIRQMMMLIEQIAARQTDVEAGDWTRWCNRLEQSLFQARQCPAVACFVQMQLNPLSPLRAAAFRPVFAEDDTTAAGRHYEQTLCRIALAWGTHDYTALEGTQ